MITGSSFSDLVRTQKAGLNEVFRSGVRPEPELLVGFEWRGFNVEWYTRLVGQKFVKALCRSSIGIEGCNIKVRRNGLAEPWIERPSPEHPKRFGFYVVDPPGLGPSDLRYPNALVFDYGASARNPRWAPERMMRSYLAQPDPANTDVMLGKACLAIGSIRMYVTFFVLERLRPTAWTTET
jgi:hypothetical protein